MIKSTVFEKELMDLQKKYLLRNIVSRSSPQGPIITIKGKKYLNFSSNDYLGLASHPEILEKAGKALKKYASGSGASRLLGGGSDLHAKLEEQVADFKVTESALIFNSGYSANIGIIPAIASEGDVIFSDELNHASIIDGCRLSQARTVVFKHRDISHLKSLILKEKARRKIIITDTVFSMDGDIAPIGEIYKLCLSLNSSPLTPHPLLLYLDDAHGTGVLGKGRGALAHFGLKPEPWIIQMGTFSKALGSYGAFAAGSRDVISWIINNARSFIFSTALPASVIAASGASISIIKKNRSLIKKLWSNRDYLVNSIKSAGYDTLKSETPIIPLLIASAKEALTLSSYLYRKGIYVPAIRPPTVKEPRLRITVSAAHTKEQLDLLIKTLKRYCKERG
ncbi:MAG: 8-amino-7-oxononanoate synthase [Nitrospirae bacterium GWC2_42_7]|nr:MAG: 8-amino-7-oxononanoate synthase [Nitrospirae bacterium GWC2_42_7]